MGCGRCVNEIGVKDVLLRGFGSPGIDKILYRMVDWRQDMEDVKVGQIWSDKDKRRIGRTIRVDSINAGQAVCKVVTPGLSKGKPVVRIRVDRFRPKYYTLKDSIALPNLAAKHLAAKPVKIIPPQPQIMRSVIPPKVDLSLVDSCKSSWDVDWKKIDQSTVGVDSGTVSVRVREVNDQCYDVKVLINSKWVFSVAMNERLPDALDKLWHVVDRLRADLCNLV